MDLGGSGTGSDSAPGSHLTLLPPADTELGEDFASHPGLCLFSLSSGCWDTPQGQGDPDLSVTYCPLSANPAPSLVPPVLPPNAELSHSPVSKANEHHLAKFPEATQGQKPGGVPSFPPHLRDPKYRLNPNPPPFSLIHFQKEDKEENSPRVSL